MTVVEAIKVVMRDAGVPLTAKEVYAGIVARSLYVFRAKNPQHVVATQIRRHCLGIDLPAASSVKHFRAHAEKKFSPLDAPIRVNPQKSE